MSVIRPHVRHAIREILRRSPSFLALSAPARLHTVRGMMQLSEQLVDLEALARPAESPIAERELDRLRRVILSNGPVAEALAQGTGDAFHAGATAAGIEQFGALVRTVDFPVFVTSLIQGVFKAIVDSSIQQMEAFGNLVSSLAKSAQQFGQENYTAGDAAQYLTTRYPGSFAVNASGRLEVKQAPSEQVREELQLPKDMRLEGQDAGAQVLDHTRTLMGHRRQQTLATLVLMGINRIGVTDGRINAKVIFDIKAQDQAEHSDKTRVDQTVDASASTSFGFWPARASMSVQSHTSVQSAIDNSSTASTEMRANLTGEVEVNFKSQNFDLNRMVPEHRVEEIRRLSNPELGLDGLGRSAR